MTIGDSAMIAANTLVISDVPASYSAIGVPAKMHPEISARWVDCLEVKSLAKLHVE